MQQAKICSVAIESAPYAAGMLMSILLTISPGLMETYLTIQHVKPLPYDLSTDLYALSCREMSLNALQ